MRRHRVERAIVTPELSGSWDGNAWADVSALRVDHFHKRSLSQHPVTEAKLLYDQDAVYVHFQVHDRHVMAQYHTYQDPVCRDSCVEFFVRPKPDAGYFNFEMNCGGTMLLYYIWDVTRDGDAFAGSVPVAQSWLERVRVFHSLPAHVDPPIHECITWRIEYRIPIALFEHYAGSLGNLGGQVWRANFYKCGGDPDYEHWVTWNPIDVLDFHQPECFGEIVLVP